MTDWILESVIEWELDPMNGRFSKVVLFDNSRDALT